MGSFLCHLFERCLIPMRLEINREIHDALDRQAVILRREIADITPPRPQ